MKNYKVHELKAIAKQHSLPYYYKLRKAELKEYVDKMTKARLTDLRVMAKEKGLENYSQLNKLDLIRLLNKKETKKDLEELAQKCGLENYSRLCKAELTDLINKKKKLDEFVKWKLQYPVADTDDDHLKNHKLDDLRAIAKRIGVENYLKLRKAEIIKSISKKKKLDEFAKKMLKLPADELKNELDKIKHEYTFEPKQEKSAFQQFTVQYRIKGVDGYDPNTFFDAVEPKIVQLLEDKSNTKVKMVLLNIMGKTNPTTRETTSCEAAFHSNVELNQKSTNTSELYDKMKQTALESMANFQRQGSNWVFRSIQHLDIHTMKYDPLKGSSYIPLPKYLETKKAIINMKNEDNECFKWSVTRALNPVDKNAERISKDLKKMSEQLNWDGIKFPVNYKDDITKFEKLNENISVNVFGYENDVYSLRLSVHERENVVNLLLISDEDKQHYCVIKNMSRLLTTQTSNRNGERHFCLRCLNSFQTEESLRKHKEYCSANKTVKVQMPEKGSYLSFEHYFKSMRVPFVIYADFEAFTETLDTCQPNPDDSYTKQYQKHSPSGFCYYVKCFDDNVYTQEPVMYTKKSEDDDIAQIFVDTLEENMKKIYHKFKFEKTMIFGSKEQKIYDCSTKCHICSGELGDDRVRDHCHYTGKFRGAAHNKCNLKFKKPKFIPVIFHNLSGYDSHLFIKNLGVSEGDISCIPNNEEKYISFTKDVIVGKFTNKEGKDIDIKRQLRFIDSFRFMASSLENLVNNLDKNKCANMKKYYSGKQLNMLLRKGVYPYDYVSSLAKLSETSLPLHEQFYSKLNDTNINDKDYTHAQKVWKLFKMKTMRDYHDLYLKSDVLLLADVFENFRDVCLTNYKLDPAWYYTSPGIAWDAALKITNVKLELLHDPDMLLLIENGIRGGVSTISTRYGKANNHYMGNDYDPNLPNKHITYLDANNLYGWAMSKSLPTHGFKWMKDKELSDWRNHSCILEVDLEYPEHLHELHNDYPLAPQNLQVGNVMKLIPNLYDKEKYVIHHENLKQYEELGLNIKKIHRGIKFEEEPWLKKYIDINTQLRSKANNEFEKDFFKLMNNSVFGKTIENIRNRVDIQLVNSEKKARKLAAKPNFEHCTIFDENLIAIQMRKTKLVFTKPVYLGMCILDLSKTLMYEFHYNYIKSKYNDKAKLLFTDTDSLAYEIETDDFYNDISNDVSDKFDTSNFPKDHSSGIFSDVNKKVVGKFKDEAGGEQITEFVGLRAKLYSYKMQDKEEKKCKGIKKAVIKKNITFEDYKTCLFSGSEQMRKMNIIRSHNHEMFTEEVNKVALSAADDKRVILPDGIHTYAHGFKK